MDPDQEADQEAAEFREVQIMTERVHQETYARILAALAAAPPAS